MRSLFHPKEPQGRISKAEDHRDNHAYEKYTKDHRKDESFSEPTREILHCQGKAKLVLGQDERVDNRVRRVCRHGKRMVMLEQEINPVVNRVDSLFFQFPFRETTHDRVDPEYALYQQRSEKREGKIGRSFE